MLVYYPFSIVESKMAKLKKVQRTRLLVLF